MVGAIALLASLGVSQEALEKPRDIIPVRLVFLATPGPGGGGGGGGLKQPAPPPRAQMKGTSALKSPVPPPRPRPAAKPDPKAREIPPPPVRPKPVEKPAEPAPAPPPPEKPMPQVVAPVVTAPADQRDRAGVLTESASEADSHGPGSGGGVGTGTGTGIGEGQGPGIGPGSGGGTGGGPYRPGSGISPPGLLREVRPDYTEEARKRGIEGEVVVEVVVRRDGSVGEVRLVQGLGGGLDQRAIDAVRQWRFSPARRHGTPVDVMVEVAVEFKLR
jgi:TonB family protein